MAAAIRYEEVAGARFFLCLRASGVKKGTLLGTICSCEVSDIFFRGR